MFQIVLLLLIVDNVGFVIDLFRSRLGGGGHGPPPPPSLGTPKLHKEQENVACVCSNALISVLLTTVQPESLELPLETNSK